MTIKRPAKTTKTLRVGVTGHRPNRMPESQWDRIKRDLATVMAEVEATHPDRRPMLLSGIAEGADRLAAFAALGRGWSLRSILAFHRTRFEAGLSRAVRHRRVPCAACRLRSRRGTQEGRAIPQPEDGYDAVARRLIASSDMLIAVWDGEGSRGKGGTVDVIEQAHARGIPVIWVHARKTQSPRRLRPPDSARDVKRLDCAQFEDARSLRLVGRAMETRSCRAAQRRPPSAGTIRHRTGSFGPSFTPARSRPKRARSSACSSAPNSRTSWRGIGRRTRPPFLPRPATSVLAASVCMPPPLPRWSAPSSSCRSSPG